jgi:hypothetical protein
MGVFTYNFLQKWEFQLHLLRGDVQDEFKGKFYLKNPGQNLKILEFISDTIFGEKPFQKHFYYTILDLENARLKITRQEHYKVGDLAVSLDRIDIFKKQ